MAKKKGILDRLKDGPVLGDGGYLLELEKRGWVRAGPFTPEVALLHPDALRELHVEFREAGADVLQALTFYASRDKLATVGLENRLEELNRAAVRIAREVAGDKCLVAGNLSLTWMYEPDSPSAADRVRKTFDEQLAVQVDEGVDFIIGETFSWLGEALIAVERAKKTGLPVMVTICFENKDETADGKSAAESAKALLDAGADIVGMNCLRPPEHTLPAMEQMRKAVSGYLACQPVAYRTPRTSPTSPACRNFPWRSIRCSSPGRKWATTRCAPGKLGSTTLVPVAARSPSMFGRWRGRWASSRKTGASGRRVERNRCRPTSITGTTQWPRRSNSLSPQEKWASLSGWPVSWGKRRSHAYSNRSRSRDQPFGTGQQRPPVRIVLRLRRFLASSCHIIVIFLLSP